ncbi:MAG: DUF2064 domain-containing protein [Solirubrobacteraceae bacterium]|nr:DUF2064 domain-containing protein [Solirubrobacteraceae bacterium]
MSVALIVIAKAPVPGRVKTRLCPPCTPQQAAAIAQGALQDTLAAVAATPATRRICVLEGDPGPWLPEGFEVIPQRGDGLDERLAAAFSDVDEPAFLVGMDTPQLTPALLAGAVSALHAPGVDAVMGYTDDGGYWGVGLHRSWDALFVGVPMSQDDTGALQLIRLQREGLVIDDTLPQLRDVDHASDARAVAERVPNGQFAQAVAAAGLLGDPPHPSGRFTAAHANEVTA